jgi:hypothetical protein
MNEVMSARDYVEGHYVELVPYVGLNGAKRWPTNAEVDALAGPLLKAHKAAHYERRAKFREALRLLREAGLHAQAEALKGPEYVEPKVRVEPRPATGNYTIDPFVGWWVKH